MTITAFGKKISREKAFQIIVNDKISEVVHASNSDTLEDLLMNGWKSLEKWTDKELEDYISTLLVDNQPNGKI